MRRGRVRLVGVTALVAGVVGAAFLGPVVVGIAGATGTARVSAEVPNPLLRPSPTSGSRRTWDSSASMRGSSFASPGPA